MSEVKYSKKHEWVSVDGDVGTVGITKHATEQLGDIVFAEIPDVGKALTSGGEAAVVESVKAASDVYTPVSGEITEGNPAIVEDPSLVNKDPEGNGWFFKIKITSPDELAALMNKADYDKFVKENPS
ncbi:glycine cleavage system protein GcvH [Pelagibacteraceae bacterium]|nr:glycine cleavage system protein GcvH [Pelagibacteraceae bacterium]